MTLLRLMACLAHPDDECFSMAGILASSTAQGVAVELICATRGEAGDIRMPGSATPASLGDVRHQELRASCNVLGIAEPIMLGYRDSGWGDDPAQRHPRCMRPGRKGLSWSGRVGYARRESTCRCHHRKRGSRGCHSSRFI
jgi:LmbE family N-acetylglucosaminyl deacetylase